MTTHLLVVEDDDNLREQLARQLTRQGFSCVTAASAKEARQTLATPGSLDAALLDQDLPDDSGLELIAGLLAHSPACRIVMLTGYGSIPAAVMATRRGAADYLTKPATVTEIVAALTGQQDHRQLPALAPAPPSLERLEWEHIQRVLESHRGNVSAAARTLGMHRRTLQRRLKKRPSAQAFAQDRNLRTQD